MDFLGRGLNQYRFGEKLAQLRLLDHVRGSTADTVPPDYKICPSLGHLFVAVVTGIEIVRLVIVFAITDNRTRHIQIVPLCRKLYPRVAVLLTPADDHRVRTTSSCTGDKDHRLAGVELVQVALNTNPKEGVVVKAARTGYNDANGEISKLRVFLAEPVA